MKKFLAVMGVILALVAAMPYLTAYRMKLAAEAEDSAALSAHIDYPAVRSSLKAQLGERADAAAASQTSGSFKALSDAFAGVLIERLVDAYVTPESIGELMTTGQGAGQSSRRPRNEGEPPVAEPKVDVALGYRGLNRFEVVVTERSRGPSARFVLTRRHWVLWKLTEIVLP